MQPPTNTHARILFAVEPNSERCWRLLAEITAYAVRLYWDLFIALPVTIISMVFAVIAVVACTMDSFQHPARFWSNLPPIGFAVAFLASRRLRAFVWALLGCLVGWLMVLVVCLFPIVGPNYQANTVAAKVLLGAIEFLPPLIAALFIDRARHRRL